MTFHFGVAGLKGVAIVAAFVVACIAGVSAAVVGVRLAILALAFIAAIALTISACLTYTACIGARELFRCRPIKRSGPVGFKRGRLPGRSRIDRLQLLRKAAGQGATKRKKWPSFGGLNGSHRQEVEERVDVQAST